MNPVFLGDDYSQNVTRDDQKRMRIEVAVRLRLYGKDLQPHLESYHPRTRLDQIINGLQQLVHSSLLSSIISIKFIIFFIIICILSKINLIIIIVVPGPALDASFASTSSLPAPLV